MAIAGQAILDQAGVMVLAQSTSELRPLCSWGSRSKLHSRWDRAHLSTNWSDTGLDRQGWKVSMIHLGALRLPFVSYEDEYFLFYAGWQWSGFLGLKFNIKNSTLQIW